MLFAWISYCLSALRGHRLRSFISAMGIAIGITAVLLLTSLGEGTRRYIVNQFTQFGTNLIAVVPGKVKTLGIPGVFGGTTRPLSLEDALSLKRLPGVLSLTPIVMGQAEVKYRQRGRSVYIYGVGPEAAETWHFQVAQGSFLPLAHLLEDRPVVVLGPTLAKEIMGKADPLGKRITLGGRPFRVVGVMEPKGRFLGFDIDDAAYIPARSAMRLFNARECNEIDIQAQDADSIPYLVEKIRKHLMHRHRGEEDFTIQTQMDLLASFGRIMRIITWAVSGIAGLSLLVGAIGILTIMWVSVYQRTQEIGLLKALGMTPRGIAFLFLLESLLLAFIGGLGGMLLTGLSLAMLKLSIPELPLMVPLYAWFEALFLSFGVGILSGLLPARRAGALEPIDALRQE